MSLSLDALIADANNAAKQAKTRKRTRSSRPDPGAALERTREELRQMALDACVPKAVVLRITRQECNCGSVNYSTNNVPLVRRESPKLTWHEPIENSQVALREHVVYRDLPRFVEERIVRIPWCSNCFGPAQYLHIPEGEA